jgi:hypothetical protein
VAEPVAQTSGAEPSAQAPPPAAAAPAAPPAPAPTGPGSVTVDAKVHGASVPAEVKLTGADGGVAASGKAGDALSVQPGDYELVVSITDSSVLLDEPSQRSALTVHAGDALHPVADFPWAKIQLNVVVNGSPTKASVHLMRQGKEVGVLQSGADFAPISPGRYEAVVKTAGASIEVHGLMFPEGATQTVPVNVSL